MTLLEIQKAADALSIQEKRDLMIFLLRSLRDHQVELPPVRDIPNETIEKWIKDDQSGYRKFLDSKFSESSEKQIPRGLATGLHTQKNPRGLLDSAKLQAAFTFEDCTIK